MIFRVARAGLIGCTRCAAYHATRSVVLRRSSRDVVRRHVWTIVVRWRVHTSVHTMTCRGIVPLLAVVAGLPVVKRHGCRHGCHGNGRFHTIEDEFSRTGLALEVAFSFPSRSVVAVLDNVAAIYGYPKYLRVDNGTELTSKLMQQWSEEHDVELLF
ncbi:MAG: DDE-type integrase/transposase/recombinase, partial [Candidatus Tyrphobacter sp.]